VFSITNETAAVERLAEDGDVGPLNADFAAGLTIQTRSAAGCL